MHRSTSTSALVPGRDLRTLVSIICSSLSWHNSSKPCHEMTSQPYGWRVREGGRPQSSAVGAFDLPMIDG